MCRILSFFRHTLKICSFIIKGNSQGVWSFMDSISPLYKFYFILHLVTQISTMYHCNISCNFRNYYQKYDQFLPIDSNYRFPKFWNFSDLNENFDTKFYTKLLKSSFKYIGKIWCQNFNPNSRFGNLQVETIGNFCCNFEYCLFKNCLFECCLFV
jgi:hypothetical protein